MLKLLNWLLKRYHPERGYLINKGLNDEALVGETRVRCLPYWELMMGHVFKIS